MFRTNVFKIRAKKYRFRSVLFRFRFRFQAKLSVSFPFPFPMRNETKRNDGKPTESGSELKSRLKSNAGFEVIGLGIESWKVGLK
jgi:hypothetical protein